MTARTGLAFRILAGTFLMLGTQLAPAAAQEPFRIGLIIPLTGGQASTGKQLDNAVKLYMVSSAIPKAASISSASWKAKTSTMP